MASEWIKHVQAYQKKHGVSYKEAMSQAKSSYKPKGQSGGGAVTAVAKATEAGLVTAGKITDAVHDRRVRSGFYKQETFRNALKMFKHLQWQRDHAVLDVNRIPKSWSDAKLQRISGLSEFK